MDEQRIRLQWQRYLDGETTKEEAEELLRELALPFRQELAEQLLEASFDKQSVEQELSGEKQQQMLSAIFGHKEKNVRRLYVRIAAAASVLIALSVGGYFILHRQQPKEQVAVILKNDIAPGSNKAVLTLANGKKIVVTGAANGTLATQAGMVVNKTAAGRISYEAGNKAAANGEVLMNTLSTQMGGETSLTLADGTEVKLDAGSSITYPVAFNGKERRVTVTGQVWFKVRHKAEQPFFVNAVDQTTRDIGTEFNISAYPGEPVKTTLIEGSIEVSSKFHTQPYRLMPGQQAITAANRLSVGEDDADEAAAWVTGSFKFNNENIHTIMEKIKRWYDIDIAYEPGVTDEGITGFSSRYKNISKVLYSLSYGGKVHFKIEGRRVTVMK
jgi:ferric-dicitrate binding protein FerR (iron transport regulator)